MSEDPHESIRLNQQDSANNKVICLNKRDSDDPRESVSLNRHDSDDPRELIRLNKYYSDLGYSGKTLVGDDTTFTTSALGLIQLSNVVYAKLSAISPRFAVSVSSSMFMYYVTQLYYMRLCILEWKVSKPEDDDDGIMYRKIRHNRWIVPQLLADYFNSIGPFKDPGGILAHHREIVFPCADSIEGINGFFGRVDCNTHAHYENRISPGVAARRIVEDLIFTARPRQNRYWDLPRILIPAEKNAGQLTGSLLGWDFASPLTTDQVAILKHCGVSFNQEKIAFSHDCTRFCHNEELMSYISSNLNELRGRVKCEERLSTIPMGSILQHDFQDVGVPPRGVSRSSVYGDVSTYNCGFAPLQMHQELLAHVFRLRTARRSLRSSNQEVTYNSWCCYDFNSFQDVPNSWTETRNLYLSFGKEKMYWDVLRFRAPPVDLKFLLNGLMEKTLIR